MEGRASITGHHGSKGFAVFGIVLHSAGQTWKQQFSVSSSEDCASRIEKVERGLRQLSWQGFVYVMYWNCGNVSPLYVGKTEPCGRKQVIKSSLLWPMRIQLLLPYR